MKLCPGRIGVSRFRLRCAGFVGVFVSLLIGVGCSRPPRFRIVIQQTTPFLESAAREVAARLEPYGYRVEISAGVAASAGLTDAMILNVAMPGEAVKPEGFEITPIQTQDYWLLRVTGGGPRAALWGALEVADQIVSQGGPGGVRAEKAEPLLAIRGCAVALPPLASSANQEPRATTDAWRSYFDLLVRSRFNSVFFEIRDDLERFVPPNENSLDFPNGAGNSGVERLHAALRLARERGLNPYAVLEKSAFAKWMGKPEAMTAAAPDASALGASAGQSPGSVRRSLPDVVGSFARNYRELEGLAIAPEVTRPVERRAAWLAENIFSPLAKNGEKRPVIIGVDADWWPTPTDLGTLETLPPVYLWASAEKPEDSPEDVPVLWQVREGPNELLPWQDPSAVLDTLQKLAGKRAAGFLMPLRSAVQESASEFADEQLPDIEREWFRVNLWGRLGYSNDARGNFWEERFASHFGGETGHYVAAAAMHSSHVLALLQSNDATPGSSFATGASATEEALIRASHPPESAIQEQILFRPVAGGMQRDLIADTLSQEGLLTDSGPAGAASLPLSDALEQQAREARDAANGAMQRITRRDSATSDFLQRLQSIARFGLAEAETLRAARLLAQFVLHGDEKLRQQAIDVLGQTQKSLSSEGDKIPRALSEESVSLSAQIASARNLAATIQPWKWDTTLWEVGVRESWQPSSPTDVPAAQSAQRVEITRLFEFGALGSAGWIGAINQRLRSAFFPPPPDVKIDVIADANSSPAGAQPTSLLVAKTSLSAKRDGRMVLRVISEEAPTVWVNRRRAARITAQQFPWIPASGATRPMTTQLYSSLIQAGANEIVVTAAGRGKWPAVSVNFLLPPDAKEIISIPLKDAARYEGGIAYAPAVEGSPQAHIGLAEPDPGASIDAQPAGGAPLAVLRFRVRDPGFYRLRLWTYWPSAERSGVALALDGTTVKANLGRNDAAYQKWHWAPLEGVFDLGPGEHTLTVGEWKRGAMLGVIEVLAGW